MVRRALYHAAVRCFLLGTILALPGAASGQSADTGDIVGQIRVARVGFLPDRVQVTLQARGAIVNQVWTDDEGRFGFFNLAANAYHLNINDEKYQPVSEDVRLSPTLQRIVVVNLTLTPKPSDKAQIPDDQIRGTNPYLLDLGRYRKQFPKKVLKEFDAGVKAEEKGKLEAAIEHFRAAIALAADFYPAHNNLGTIYLTQKDFPAAEAEFRSVLTLNKTDVQALFNLGNILLLTKRYTEALQAVQEGTRRQPNAALGHWLLGAVYLKTGRLVEAEAELRRAGEMDPELARVHLELVNLYLEQGRTEQAKGELEMFLQRFPADQLAPQARELLARLEGAPATKP
jgi:tetratricopeptide (TPR) repeat protein